MMKNKSIRRILMISIFLLPTMFANAQLSMEDIGLNVSYFGESAIHPGLKVGAEYSLWSKEKIKTRRPRKEHKGAKTKYKELVWTGNIGGFVHPNNSNVFFLNTELGYRRTNHKGRIVGAFVGIGALKSFYNIDTYQLGTTEPEALGAAGGFGFMPSISFMYGKDLSVKRNIPISWHIKPTLLLQTNYNHTTVPRAALELGITKKF